MIVKCVNLTQFSQQKCELTHTYPDLFSASQPEEKQYQKYDQGYEKDDIFGFF